LSTGVVSAVSTETVIVTADGVEIVSVGLQGPPGPRGPAGPPGPPAGGQNEYTAAIALSGHRILTTDQAGRAIYADSANPAHVGRIVGLSTGAAAAGAPIIVQLSGEFSEPTWSWSLTCPVYLGAAGHLTQTPPSEAGSFSVVVGFPITPTRLFLSIREPILIA
jgi:hypothetical protein